MHLTHQSTDQFTQPVTVLRWSWKFQRCPPPQINNSRQPFSARQNFSSFFYKCWGVWAVIDYGTVPQFFPARTATYLNIIKAKYCNKILSVNASKCCRTTYIQKHRCLSCLIVNFLHKNWALVNDVKVERVILFVTKTSTTPTQTST